MKYIRTEDGIWLFGGTHHNGDVIIGKKHEIDFGFCFDKKDVIKQADTIEELIMPGDLVRYDGLYMSWIEKDRGDKVRGIDMHLISRKSVDMLWIPTGNDTECYPNFKLVASKEDEEGALELL